PPVAAKPPMAPPPPAEMPEDEAPATQTGEGPWTYTVYFGTNRAPVDSSNPGAGFLNEADAGGKVWRGKCAVNIPKAHEFGAIESSLTDRLLGRKDALLHVERITSFDQVAFEQEIRTILQHLRPQQADLVLYLHGYNNSFEEAAARAAQVGFD